MRIVVPFPPKELSPNGRPVRQALWRHKKAYRETVWGLALEKGANRLTGPFSITVTFCPRGRGPVPDLDNCIASFKAGQDGLCDALRINDRDLNGHVNYQIGDRSKDGGVIVEVMPRDDAWKSIGEIAAGMVRGQVE